MSRPTDKELWKKHISEAMLKDQPEKISRLKEAFAMDCTIAEACCFAEISLQTYYTWIKKNPELLDEFQEMKNKLPLAARNNIKKGLESGDVPLSERYLTRKGLIEPDKVSIEHNITGNIPANDRSAVEEFHSKLKGNIRERSLDKAKQDGELPN